MSNKIQKSLMAAALEILKPLVRVMLRNNASQASLAELVRKAYVDVATEELVSQGKRPTDTLVSALTGLSRKEAKRLRELGNIDTDNSEQRYNRAIRVLSGWANDAEFSDEKGKASELPFESSTEPSFSKLVKKFGGDVTPRSMQTALIDSKAIKKTKSGRLKIIQQRFVPNKDVMDKVRILGADPAELIATIDHNIINSDEFARFQRKVSYKNISLDDAARFKLLSSKKSQKLLEELDGWLNERELSDKAASKVATRYVSLGIYFYEYDQNRGNSDEKN